MYGAMHVAVRGSVPNGKGLWKACQAGDQQAHEGHDGVLQHCTQHDLPGRTCHIGEVLHCTHQPGLRGIE